MPGLQRQTWTDVGPEPGRTCPLQMCLTCGSFTAVVCRQSSALHQQHGSVQLPRSEPRPGKGEVHSLPVHTGVDQELGAVQQQQPVALPAASGGRPRQQEPTGGRGGGGEEEARGCGWSCGTDRQSGQTGGGPESRRARSSPVLKLLSDWLLSRPLLVTTTTLYVQPGVN